jgi:hypothetical protein
MYFFTKKNPHSSLIFLFVFTPSSNYSINCTITRYTCIELTRIKGTFQSLCLQDIQWNRRSFIIRNTWLSVCDDIIISFVLAFLRWFYVLLALACPSLFLYSLLIISRNPIVIQWNVSVTISMFYIKWKPGIPHHRNNSIVNYQHRRKRQNRYP